MAPDSVRTGEGVMEHKRAGVEESSSSSSSSESSDSNASKRLHELARIAMISSMSKWPPVSGHPGMEVAIEVQF
jgi:hypothetical protein